MLDWFLHLRRTASVVGADGNRDAEMLVVGFALIAMGFFLL